MAVDDRDQTFSEVDPVERHDWHPVDWGTLMLVELQLGASVDDARVEVDTWAVDRESVVGTIAVAKQADRLSAVGSWAAAEMEVADNLNTAPGVVVDTLAVAGSLDAALEVADRPAVVAVAVEEVEDRIAVVERRTERLDRLNAMDCILVVANTRMAEDYMTFVRCEEVIALVDGED